MDKSGEVVLDDENVREPICTHGELAEVEVQHFVGFAPMRGFTEGPRDDVAFFDDAVHASLAKGADILGHCRPGEVRGQGALGGVDASMPSSVAVRDDEQARTEIGSVVVVRNDDLVLARPQTAVADGVGEHRVVVVKS